MINDIVLAGFGLLQAVIVAWLAYRQFVSRSETDRIKTELNYNVDLEKARQSTFIAVNEAMKNIVSPLNSRIEQYEKRTKQYEKRIERYDSEMDMMRGTIRGQAAEIIGLKTLVDEQDKTIDALRRRLEQSSKREAAMERKLDEIKRHVGTGPFRNIQTDD